MPSTDPSKFQRILETRLTQMAGELQYAFEAEVVSQTAAAVRSLSAEIATGVRVALAEELNQWVRRVRQAASPEEAAVALADGAVSFAGGAAVFRVAGGMARAMEARGAALGGMEIPLAAAPALATAVETRDPVMAMAGGAEIPASLREAIGAGAEDKVLVVPVVAEGSVTALLLAWGAAHPAALELVAQLAAVAFPAPPPPPPVAAELVTIAPAPARAAWEDLSPEEQKLHLAAQRFARVRVAEMRLYHAEAVEEGRRGRDLYHALREPVDSAREAFRRKFVAASPTMADYLHLEMLRTLGENDIALLGHDYPGSLV